MMNTKPYALCMGFVAVAVSAANAQQLPTLDVSNYGQWEALGRGSLSPNGAWFTVPITRTNGEDELRIYDLSSEVGSRVVAFGTDATFAPNSRWLVYHIGVSDAERERLMKEETPVRLALGVLDLTSGTELVVDGVADFSFSPSGDYIAMVRYAEETSGRKPDLVVRALSNGNSSTFGNVAAHSWSDQHDILALTIETPSDGGNGVQLYEPAHSRLRTLASGSSIYKNLAWREDAADLAVFETVADDGHEDETHMVLAWHDLASPSPRAWTLGTDVLEDDAGLGVSEHRLVWSADGQRLFIGLRPRQKKIEEPTRNENAEDPEEKTKASDVQVWHAKDVRIFPMQRAQEDRDMARSSVAVWDLESGSLRNLQTDLMSDIDIVHGDWLLTERVETPYHNLTQFGREYADVHIIDVRTGTRTVALERVRHFYGASPGGQFLLYFDSNGYWTYDLETGEKRNLAAGMAQALTNLEYDYPVELFPPFGVGGWMDDDAGILVYDEYDVWLLSTVREGPRRLTTGREDGVIHRVVNVGNQEAFSFDVPLYYSLFSKNTKKSGFARGSLNQNVERLVYEDARVTRLAKADSVDVFVFSRERFDDSPNYFMSDGSLSTARRITQTNPFQADFAWGHAELIEYRDPEGRELHGVLLYPPNHDPSRRYPMIVYQYEIMSHQLHAYTVPSERRYYNTTVWNQNGYFVLLPDIVYTGRDPGLSALHAIESAIDAVVERNVIDPQRIGLIGHSWGGYQATFLPTQTDRFAAVVAGAPLTNFLSMMGAIHWRPGLPETGHWETGQARMEVPFWEDFDAHVRNSPAAHIANLNTPMLMMFGDDDGTVDFRQGVEFYNYARRAGKDDFVMLVYPGEDHGLREEANQIDYHRRIAEWFDHYLKGKPAASWITDGVPFLEQKSRF